MKQITDLKIVTSFPPNFRDIVDALGDHAGDKPVYCYGKVVYNPYSRPITPDIEVHEEVHSRQQGNSPAVWWHRYLTDPQFRLEQEVEAYGTQYAFARKHVKHEKLLRWAREKMAQSLSSAAYGNLIGYAQADSRIRNYAKSL